MNDLSKPAQRIPLDDFAIQIIAELERNPMISNQALADALGVTKSQVLTRLRHIEANDAAHVIAQTSAFEGGYRIYEVFLTVRDRDVSEVGHELALLDGALLISALVGEDDLYMIFRAHHTIPEATVFRTIGGHSGVARIRFESVFEALFSGANRISFIPGRVQLPLEERKQKLASDLTSLKLDDLDLTIIAELHEQGRRSLRSIARSNNATEGTVRYRVGNLQAKNLLKIITAVEPTVVGRNTWSIIELMVNPSRINQLAIDFGSFEWMEILTLKSGAFNSSCMALTTDQDELSRVLRGMRSHPAVQHAHVTLLAAIYKIDSRWYIPCHSDS